MAEVIPLSYQEVLPQRAAVLQKHVVEHRFEVLGPPSHRQPVQLAGVFIGVAKDLNGNRVFFQDGLNFLRWESLAEPLAKRILAVRARAALSIVVRCDDSVDSVIDGTLQHLFEQLPGMRTRQAQGQLGIVVARQLDGIPLNVPLKQFDQFWVRFRPEQIIWPAIVVVVDEARLLIPVSHDFDQTKMSDDLQAQGVNFSVELFLKLKRSPLARHRQHHRRFPGTWIVRVPMKHCAVVSNLHDLWPGRF